MPTESDGRFVLHHQDPSSCEALRPGATFEPIEVTALVQPLDLAGRPLSFTEESPGNGSMHIGCSPSSREFFTQVFQEALAARQPLPEPALAGPRS